MPVRTFDAYQKTFKGVKSVTKPFSNGVARYEVVHTGDLDPIVAALDSRKSGVAVSITGAEGGKVEGRIK